MSFEAVLTVHRVTKLFFDLKLFDLKLEGFAFRQHWPAHHETLWYFSMRFAGTLVVLSNFVALHLDGGRKHQGACRVQNTKYRTSDSWVFFYKKLASFTSS